VTLEEFFAGREKSQRIFGALRAAVESLGPVELRSEAEVDGEVRSCLREAWKAARA
jgi:hypothetical protein